MQPEDSNKPLKDEEPIEQKLSDIVEDTQPSAVVSEHSKKRIHFTRKQLLLAGVAVLLLLGGAGFVWWQHRDTPAAQPVVSQTKKTTTPSKTTAPVPTNAELAKQLALFITPTTGETWYATPKQADNLGYHKDYEGGAVSTYYAVGTRGTSTIYISVTEEIGTYVQLYEKGADGVVKAILHPNANVYYNPDYDSSAKTTFGADVQTDTTIHYDSLSPPASIGFGTNQTAKLGQDGYASQYIGTFIGAESEQSGVTVTTIKTLGQSKLIKLERTYADTGLTTINYLLDTPVGTRIALNYQPISTDGTTYTWSNGVAIPDDNKGTHSSNISGLVRGCSSLAGAVTRSDAVSDADFAVTGKTADGKTVYAFKDKNHVLVQKTYTEYKDAYTTYGEKIISLDDFLSQHGLLAYKDTDGTWLIYSRSEFAPFGGCAKPVVYLYPTQTQNVTVKVGADVKVSDPSYNPKSGWRVVAQPNGQLSVGGKSYGSLFWEGPGNGNYPAITSGTVVKRSDAAATIRQQLAQQGLNAQETKDFMAYWESKIPNKPYIRLVWFNTAQMNELAPLYVSPKPTTVIRVFLDMDGLDKPINLPAQQLSAVPRTGFTVVEWGGLAQGKLY